MPILIILLVAATAIVAVALAISTHRATNARWAEAAEQLGLDLTGGGTFSFPRMDGLIDHYAVSVQRFTCFTSSRRSAARVPTQTKSSAVTNTI